MTTQNWVTLIVAVIGAVSVGGWFIRWLIPSMRRHDNALTREAEARTQKTVKDAVGSEVSAVTDAVSALRDTLSIQRSEFTARDSEKAAQIRELRSEVRALRALFRGYVSWSRPAIDAWREKHPDYPDPPQLEIFDD